MLSYAPNGWQPPVAASTPKKKQKMDADLKAASLAFKVKNILTAAAKVHAMDSTAEAPSFIRAPSGRGRKKPLKERPRPLSEAVHACDRTVRESIAMSGKDRLLAIIAAEKATKVEAAKAADISAAAYDSSSICTASTTSSIEAAGVSEKNGSSFFQRGVDSIRRSLRSKASAFKKMSDKKAAADFSHDSGLGEDSDTSHRNSPVTPATSSASPTIPTPILRTSRSYSSGSGPSTQGLKHVSIRMPSVRDLPSTLRNSFPGAKPMKPQLVKLETVERRLYRHAYKADNLAGDVGPQWGSIYFRASQQVRACLGDQSHLCDLIFCNSKRTIEDKLMIMEANEVDETIHLLYKILYHDWLEQGHDQQLPIILHCVQKFLVIVVDICPELEAEDKRKLSICARGLLRQCEDAKYEPVGECLTRTRSLYIQVWCAILCIPFVPN